MKNESILSSVFVQIYMHVTVEALTAGVASAFSFATFHVAFVLTFTPV